MAEEVFDLLDYSYGEPAPEQSEPEVPTESVPSESEPNITLDDESTDSHESALLQRLEEETGRRLQLERELPTDPADPVAPLADPDFLEGMDLDEVLSSSDNLNRLLLAVYNRGINESMRRASDNVLGSVQELVSRYVRDQLSMSEMVKEFYDANEDLRPLRRTVAAYAKEISRDNPDLKPQDVFTQTATKVRTALKLKKLDAPATTTKRSFVPQRGRKANLEPELTGIEREIMELVDI